jgi:hypothetical protein
MQALFYTGSKALERDKIREIARLILGGEKNTTTRRRAVWVDMPWCFAEAAE